MHLSRDINKCLSINKYQPFFTSHSVFPLKLKIMYFINTVIKNILVFNIMVKRQPCINLKRFPNPVKVTNDGYF